MGKAFVLLSAMKAHMIRLYSNLASLLLAQTSQQISYQLNYSMFGLKAIAFF